MKTITPYWSSKLSSAYASRPRTRDRGRKLAWALLGLLCLAATAGAAADSTTVDSLAQGAAPDSTAAADSLAGTSPDSGAVPDTANDSLPPGTADSGAAKQTAPQDTTPFWHSPHLGLHVSWSLGGFPAFATWEDDLPRSRADFGVSSDIITGDSLSGFDTLDLVYDIREQPNSYNVAFPVGLAYTFLATPTQSVSVDAAFSFLYKKQQAVFEIDSLPQKVRTERFLGVYTIDLGLTYRVRIPQLYFSVDNTHATELALGIGVHPFQYLTRDDDVIVTGGTHSGLHDAEAAARALSRSVSTFGTGMTWRVGIGSIKRLTSNSGLRTTLSYVGRWHYFSRIDANDLRTLNQPREPGDASFVAHRFAITLELLRGFGADKDR
ncbi:MAG: hypothetical protein GF331_05900 [Chitinivibrionales bacterium]|nr:hypothetical protein [Chitinivibrionales bacterium]